MINHWDLLEEIDKYGENLTPWEIAFVEDLLLNESKIILTDKMKEIIERIHSERVKL